MKTEILFPEVANLCGDLTKRHPPFEAQMRHERQTGIPAVFRRFVVAWV